MEKLKISFDLFLCNSNFNYDFIINSYKYFICINISIISKEINDFSGINSSNKIEI